jgi:hypothetical protein
VDSRLANSFLRNSPSLLLIDPALDTYDHNELVYSLRVTGLRAMAFPRLRIIGECLNESISCAAARCALARAPLGQLDQQIICQIL